jgi:hypothetical protein
MVGSYFQPFSTAAMASSDNLHDVQLVPIVPSKSLGGFLRGTLRFESSQIEKHMQLGYLDAKAAIDKALGNV